MKSFIISLIFFLSTMHCANAQLSTYKKILDKSPILSPFHVLKKTAEKISSFGLKKLFFGVTVGAMLSEAYNNPKDIENRNSDNFKGKEDNIKKIISKGQVFINNIDENEAKRRALEDALYYAAIKGGARVDGFSSIKSDTSLEEHFTVRPRSKILDYRILKSYIEENIYIVEIEAIVGNISKNPHVCKNEKPITIKEFKGSNTIISNMPAKYDNLGFKIINMIGTNLKNLENVSYYNNKKDYYNFNKSNFDLAYDYKTLVNGDQDVRYGDYIYIPNIKLSKSKVYPITYLIRDKKIPTIENPSYFLDSDVLRVDISIDIFNGLSNNLVKTIKDKYLIPLNIDSNFEYIEIFTKNDDEYINSETYNIAFDVARMITQELICQPLTANINFVNNKLIVPIGKRNGVKENQLAVLENSSNNTEWTILSVSSLTDNSATLIPLNSNIKINQLAGKKTRFLE